MFHLVDLAYKYCALIQRSNAFQSWFKVEFPARSYKSEREVNELSATRQPIVHDPKMDRLAAMRFSFPVGLSSQETIARILRDIARVYYKEPSVEEIVKLLLTCSEEQQTEFICFMMDYFRMSHSRFLTISSTTDEDILRDQIAILCRGEMHREYVGAYLKECTIDFFSHNMTFSEGNIDECWKEPLRLFLVTLTTVEKGNIENLINKIKEK